MPFRFDRNGFVGGVLIYVRKDISCKQLNKQSFNDIEETLAETNLRKLEWLLFGTYAPLGKKCNIF